MTEHVLTDNEVEDMAWSQYGTKYGLARAVEAAVLAKRPKPVYELWEGDARDATRRALEDAGYVVVITHNKPEKYVVVKNGVYVETRTMQEFVSAVESRERERAAWDACAAYWCQKHSYQGGDARDRRYPSLKPVEPPPLVLSDGSIISRDATGVLGEWKRSRRSKILGGIVQTEGHRHPFIWAKTPTDARLLAELVEKYGTP